MSRKKRNTLALRCTLLLTLVWAGIAKAEKTDIIYLTNGDRITCEIKKLERSQLTVSTDGMGTVSIEWKDIARVISTEFFLVELTDGSRVQGSLADGHGAGNLVVANGGEQRAIDMADVVWINPLKLDEPRLEQWDGSVSAGFNIAKANSDTSVTGSFSASRRAESYVLNFSGSIYSDSRDDAENSVRANLQGAYRRLLADRWFWALMASAERNDELGIDLRSLLGAGYGRYLVQSGRTLWALTGGLSVSNEQEADTSNSQNNLEGFLGSDFEFFTYDSPKTSITNSIALYPGITQSGRLRGNVELGLRRELVKDLFIELSVYDTFDNQPPEGGESNDYGIATSLGYTF